jgi:hypothetical protein
MEGTPGELRSALKERILELRGEPLTILRQAAEEDVDVEEAHAFGDRLHLRVRPGAAPAVIARLPDHIRARGGRVDDLRLIPPGLEDVFIALSKSED